MIYEDQKEGSRAGIERAMRRVVREGQACDRNFGLQEFHSMIWRINYKIRVEK